MQIKREFGKDIKADPRRAKYEQKLMVECNQIKHELSTIPSTQSVNNENKGAFNL
jgi:hypothetical protein